MHRLAVLQYGAISTIEPRIAIVLGLAILDLALRRVGGINPAVSHIVVQLQPLQPEFRSAVGPDSGIAPAAHGAVDNGHVGP